MTKFTLLGVATILSTALALQYLHKRLSKSPAHTLFTIPTGI
jgi:hypothetical protein